MGRAGGSYEQGKDGKKKLLEHTKDASPVNVKKTKLERHQEAGNIAEQPAADKTSAKQAKE